MLTEKMAIALNKQINEEMYSAYLYLAMSTHYAAKSLNGFAHWLKVQYDEEMAHAMKIYHYMLEQGASIEFLSIAQPKFEATSDLKIFEQVLKHEQYISQCFSNLMDLALSEKDHATTIFLQWFIMEQVEEEANAGELVNKLRIIDGAAQMVFSLDRQLGLRKMTTVESEES